MAEMTLIARSPRIKKLSWGYVGVEGQEGTFKDVKLFPGGARAWDWNETATNHNPGIQTADVKELVEKGANVIVLSMGINKRLRVMPETLIWLRDRGVTVYVMQTEEAVRQYNELAETMAVGALIHSTC
jgi:hypothetical protein